MAKYTIKDMISDQHPLYQRYNDSWKLNYDAYIGGVEWRKGTYLKAHGSDFQTPSEEITAYDENGNYKGYTKLQPSPSSQAADQGVNMGEGTFYGEKLRSTPLFPYVRLYTSEYNAILFNILPTREIVADTQGLQPHLNMFLGDVDGEGNSINEFMSQVDVLSTVYGIVWVECYLPAGFHHPLWKLHKPTDVKNWKYSYDTDGRLKLEYISMLLQDNEDFYVYKIWTNENYYIVWEPKSEDAHLHISGPVYKDGYYVIEGENELGYIPVKPIYQSMKVDDGVGHTPIFDIAQCQKAVYNYTSEIYSGITYGAHPVNIVDEKTKSMNDSISAEPGSLITVESPDIAGNGGYVFDFKAPSMESITKIEEYINGIIEKMNTVAMIRSEDLIKASRSGAQIEQYDSKLEAFIRKKATSLENAEFKLWNIWFDWMDAQIPEDFSVSYQKDYGKKSLETGIATAKGMMELYENFIANYADDSNDEDAVIAADLKVALKSRLLYLFNSSSTKNSQ